MSGEKINERQKRFIDNYIKTGNATESARLAGYNKKTASVIGYENLRKPNISREIERRLKELETERTADLKETLEFATAVMRGQVVEVVIVGKERIEVPPSTRDRLKAAEYLLKVHGAFKQDVQVTTTIPIVITGGDELED